MRSNLPALLLLVPMLAACETETPTAAEVAPNVALRNAVVSSPSTNTRPARPGYDEHGRLKAARDLVSGFEVPEGVQLVESRPEYLVFSHTASPEELAEFWSGGDKGNGHPVSERHYDVQPGRRGFEVHHTEQSLGRLHLDDRYKDTHLFVTPGGGRQELIRVHLPPGEGAAGPRRFLSPVNDERPGERGSGAPTGSGSSAPQEASPTSTPPPPTPGSPPDPNVQAGSPPQPTAAPEGPPPGHFPVPPRGKQPIIDKVRAWKVAHPGATFLD